MTLFSHEKFEDDPVLVKSAEIHLEGISQGQKVRTRNGTILSFKEVIFARQAELYYFFEHAPHNRKGKYPSNPDFDIVEILPMTTTPENASPTMETPAPTAVSTPAIDNTPAVDAVPAPTTMQDLFNAALAELSTSDQQIVQEHIKNRLIEVQRLRTLLDKAERELNDFMSLPLEEAVLRLTRQSSYTGMRFRAIDAPKTIEQLKYGG